MTEHLDAGVLLARARVVAGEEVGDDPAFADLLSRWLESMDTDANLNDLGRASTAGETERLLGHRLRLERELRAHAEIRDEVVDDPIVITGLARTGTTKLQRLIAAVPSMQKAPYWRLVHPTPLPGSEGIVPDPRIDLARQQLSMMAEHAPEVLALHPMVAEEADEEIFAMELTFDCLASALRAGPSFREWWVQRDPRPSYDYLRQLLQYWQWADGGRRGPWVLKAPAHLGNLDTVVEVFPNATIVHCHRDPRQTFVSGMRLHEVAKTMSTNGFDPTEAGPRLLAYWSGVMQQNLAQRERPEVARHVLDVSFSQVCSSPVDVVRSVLDRHGTALDEGGVRAIEAWLEADAHDSRTQFGTHGLERYGLSDEAVADAFADYLARFGEEVR